MSAVSWVPSTANGVDYRRAGAQETVVWLLATVAAMIAMQVRLSRREVIVIKKPPTSSSNDRR